MTYTYQFVRCIYARLPFKADLNVRHISEKDIRKLKNLPIGFDIVNDILVVGYDKDTTEKDMTLYRVIQL